MKKNRRAVLQSRTGEDTSMNLKGRSFLTLLDYSAEEIEGLLDLAAALKAKKKAGIPHADFVGKNIALIFEKTSTRTRCSFEVAAHASNTAASARRSWKRWRSTPGCRCGTA